MGYLAAVRVPCTWNGAFSKRALVGAWAPCYRQVNACVGWTEMPQLLRAEGLAQLMRQVQPDSLTH